jgi:NADH-quinone oxidoreductase subunit N
VATAFLIVGLGVIISRTGGSLGLDAVRTAAAAPATSAGVAVGLVLILSALAFKAGAFPFHSWMPDALETAPPAAAAVLASAGKVGPVAAAVWLVIAVKGTSGGSALAAIALIAVASIVFGNLAALRQRSLARMLAYSAIAQIGYAFAGLPAGNGSGPALIFILLYALTSVASFVFIVAMGEVEPDWDGSIGGLAGLSRRHPALTASLTVIMLSLTGIPLTAGFWGKFLVFGTIATHGYLWLAIVGVLGSVVSFGYYGGVLRAAFMDEGPVGMPATGATPPVPGERRRTATSATVVLALAIVVIGLVPFVTGLGVFGPLR